MYESDLVLLEVFSENKKLVLFSVGVRVTSKTVVVEFYARNTVTQFKLVSELSKLFKSKQVHRGLSSRKTNTLVQFLLSLYEFLKYSPQLCFFFYYQSIFLF